MSTIVTRSGKGVPLTATDHDNNINNLNNDKVESLSDLNIDATSTELNYVDGVTSAIQTQLDGKVAKAGDTMTGNLSLGDSVKAQFGASDDLQIYHDGDNSYIAENGTGNLYLKASHLVLSNSAGANYLVAYSGGSVNLYNNNQAKLATTSTGIDVTGTVTLGDSHVIGNDQYDNLTLLPSTGENLVYQTPSQHIWRVGATTVDNGTDAMRIDSSGKVGIGTSSPSEDLTIAGTKSGNSVTDAIIDFGILNSNGHSKKAQIKSILTSDVSSELIFSTTATHSFAERMRIDSAGRVTMPYQPAFRAENTGDFSLITNVAISSQGTWAAYLNRGSVCNTSNGRFTVPVSGVYWISFGITMSSTNTNAGDGWSAIIYKNGTAYFNQEFNYAMGSVSGEERHSGNGVAMNLSANDYLQVGTHGLNGSTGFTCLYATLSGHLIG